MGASVVEAAAPTVTQTTTPPGSKNFVAFTGDFAYDYQLLRRDLGWDKNDDVVLPHTSTTPAVTQEPRIA